MAPGRRVPLPCATSGRAINAVGILQLDAISVVARTQFLVLFSRVGAYSQSLLHQMAGPGGELFECAGYRAAADAPPYQPLFRWQAIGLAAYNSDVRRAARWQAYRQANADYIDTVRREIGQRGPLTASRLTDPRRRGGEWWERRSDGRRALEFLFNLGELGAWRTSSFERVYDLVERVIPAPILSLPTPSAEDAQRALVLAAAQALGIGTAADLAGYHLLEPAVGRARVAELVEAGQLTPVQVEGWRQPAYLDAKARPAKPTRTHATLVSPFDSLIWDRRRTRRLFGFDYRIEVYVPEPQRRYGYYVLPLLVGDRLVARFDLKADRKASALRVAGAYAEPEVDLAHVAELAAAELEAMGAWLGLQSVTVGRPGKPGGRPDPEPPWLDGPAIEWIVLKAAINGARNRAAIPPSRSRWPSWRPTRPRASGPAPGRFTCIPGTRAARRRWPNARWTRPSGRSGPPLRCRSG